MQQEDVFNNGRVCVFCCWCKGDAQSDTIQIKEINSLKDRLQVAHNTV